MADWKDPSTSSGTRLGKTKSAPYTERFLYVFLLRHYLLKEKDNKELFYLVKDICGFVDIDIFGNIFSPTRVDANFSCISSRFERG
jgi:hypothetical protein